MPTKCCVYGCKNTNETHGLSFYSIPSLRRLEGDAILDLTKERQRLWLQAINRAYITLGSIRSHYKVCCDHFVSGKPAYYRMHTSPDWIPHLNLSCQVGPKKKRNMPVLGDHLLCVGKSKSTSRQSPLVNDQTNSQQWEDEANLEVEATFKDRVSGHEETENSPSRVSTSTDVNMENGTDKELETCSPDCMSERDEPEHSNQRVSPIRDIKIEHEAKVEHDLDLTDVCKQDECQHSPSNLKASPLGDIKTEHEADLQHEADPPDVSLQEELEQSSSEVKPLGEIKIEYEDDWEVETDSAIIMSKHEETESAIDDARLRGDDCNCDGDMKTSIVQPLEVSTQTDLTMQQIEHLEKLSNILLKRHVDYINSSNLQVLRAVQET